jgi:hypothetical protein
VYPDFNYRTLAPKAVERLHADSERLITFCQFPRSIGATYARSTGSSPGTVYVNGVQNDRAIRQEADA